jgi:hypothetical protein
MSLMFVGAQERDPQSTARLQRTQRITVAGHDDKGSATKGDESDRR